MVDIQLQHVFIISMAQFMEDVVAIFIMVASWVQPWPGMQELLCLVDVLGGEEKFHDLFLALHVLRQIIYYNVWNLKNEKNRNRNQSHSPQSQCQVCACRQEAFPHRYCDRCYPGGMTAETVSSDIYQLRTIPQNEEIKLEWKLTKFQNHIFTKRNSFSACASEHKIYIWGGLETEGMDQKCLSDLIEIDIGTSYPDYRLLQNEKNTPRRENSNSFSCPPP